VDAKVIVVSVGALLEFVGIGLVASPELAPWVRRLGDAVRRAGQRARARLRRLLRRPRHVVMGAAAGEYGLIGSSVSGEVTPGKDATLERKIDFLMEETKRTRRRLSELKREIANHPGRWHRAIEAAKGDLESLMDEKVEAVRDAHLNVRRWGVVLVLLGVPLLAWGNFL
jgi:hypothetical protein